MHEISDCLPNFRSLTFLVLTFLIMASSASAQEIIFADDFEQGTPIAWTKIEKLHPATAFLITDLDLRDPHFFVPVPFLGCLDLTDAEIPGVTASLNQQIEAAITGDTGSDGWLDFSFLLLFRPLDVNGLLDMRLGLCSSPVESTSCVPSPMPARLWAHYDTQASGICLDTIAGSTSGYLPEIDVPAAPCFAALELSTILPLDDQEVPLQDAQIGAEFTDDPTDSLINGLVRAFLHESDADAITIPADIPLIGGQPVSAFLPGGASNCAALDDRDILNSETGWWLYFNFEAQLVPYSEN